jgi:hypothetical protein
MNPRNPFDLVKATDLNDRQISDYWVDIPGGSSLLARVKPTSPMPMFILGGKGSGKTHLMRYLSFPLQGLRHGSGDALRAGIKAEGYIGIYLRCGGLNASRFAGKGQGGDTWTAVFSYYFELWLAQLALTTIRDLTVGAVAAADEAAVARSILDLFDTSPFKKDSSLGELIDGIRQLQKEADLAVNNAAISRKLDVRIVTSPGSLFFGIPRLCQTAFPDLNGLRFVYLIDEYENLTADQQLFLNTLVRERSDPVGIKIGARLYGVRTHQTLNTGEENRRDSEFEELQLDFELRGRPAGEYRTFVETLVTKRLSEAGYVSSAEVRPEAVGELFEKVDVDTASTRDAEAQFFGERFPNRDRPHMKKLREQLEVGSKSGATPGLSSADDISSAMTSLTIDEDPFSEKVSVFLFYRAWASREDLLKASQTIQQSADAFRAGKRDSEHERVLRHYKSDILAQLLRETRRPQRYVGFEAFVEMSSGLPRCVLTILKHVYTWSVFYGEEPFRKGVVSIRAQQEGVKEAAEWFFSEARASGREGALVRSAMNRLGELLRDLRFSDKPSECALSTFSVDLAHVTSETRRLLVEAERWSMLIEARDGQHERNTGRVDPKYRIHPMLAPRWDLPLASRGAIALSGDEGSAIFDEERADKFPGVRDERVQRMMAPFFGKRSPSGAHHRQATFPGIGND